MNKQREMCGIKVFVSNEAYNEYKGTLQEQLEEKDKEIEKLKSIIKEANDYIQLVETLATVDHVNIFSMSIFKEILDKGE